jgi:hypothetical protein
MFAHNHLVAQKFTGKQIKWEVVTRPAAGERLTIQPSVGFYHQSVPIAFLAPHCDIDEALGHWLGLIDDAKSSELHSLSNFWGSRINVNFAKSWSGDGNRTRVRGVGHLRSEQPPTVSKT